MNRILTFKELPEPPENPLEEGIVVPVSPEDERNNKEE